MSAEHQVQRALQQAVSYWLVTDSDVAQGDLKMTEAELWHMHLLAVENTFVGMENVATIIFAYLATAYFVGGKLTRFQAALATVFFVSVASMFSAFAFTEYRRVVYFLSELTENYGVSAMLPNDVILPVGAIVLALLVPACVYFMYQVRRNARPDNASG